MNPMVSKYERELLGVLSGYENGVNAVIKSCNEQEKLRMRKILQRPFLVVRAAGSGSEGTGDLLALRGDLCFPIEVKTTKSKKLYLSGRTKEQYDAMVREGERCGLMPLYAHRLKGTRGDSWRIFRVETSSLTGSLRKLERKIPSLPLTRNGSKHIDWDLGMPLNTFISILCSEDTKFEALKQRADKQKTPEYYPKNAGEEKIDYITELLNRRS